MYEDVEHVAYVRGRSRADGDERKYACRIVTRVEVEEPGLGDTELAFAVRHGVAVNEYRLWNGRLFKRLYVSHGAPSVPLSTQLELEALREDWHFATKPYHHDLFDAQQGYFGGIGKPPRHVGRPPSREKLRATSIREEDIEHWRERMRERAANVLVIDGKLWARTFEPAYRVVSGIDAESALVNDGRVSPAEANVYRDWIDARRPDLFELEWLPSGDIAKSPLYHFFSVNERDEMEAFLDLVRDRRPSLRREAFEIDVIRPDIATPTLVDHEAVRFAKIWTRKLTEALNDRFREPLHPSTRPLVEALRTNMRSWEADATGMDRVLDAFDACRAANPDIGVDLGEFDLRQGMRPLRPIDIHGISLPTAH